MTVLFQFMDEVIELKPILDTEEDYKPPAYGIPGRILFEVYPNNAESERFEVIDYDPETSLFWLNEGLGFEWFFEECTDYDKLEVGRYIMTVNGRYISGLSWRESPEPTDDDEEWEIVEEAVKTDLESLL